jgi:hypothetical protein
LPLERGLAETDQIISEPLLDKGATRMSRARAKRIVDQVQWQIIASLFPDQIRTRICHINYYVVEGKTKGNRYELRALVFGRSEFLHYLIDLVYSELHQIKSTGRTTLEKITSISKEVAPDVVFAEFHCVFSNAMSKRFLILPDLTWSLDITPSLEILISKMKRHRRRCVRTIQATEYTYEYTDSAEKFDFFYNRMYCPYISKTHGESTRLVSKEISEKIFQSGGLFLLKSEGKYVSGILFSKRNHTIECALLAISPDIGREIAGQAALYGLIKWAKEEGFTEIGYGETPPFVGDGLFEYKRTWGMQVKLLSERAFGIHLCNLTDGVLDFLVSNPLVFTCSHDLAILILLNVGDIDPKALYRRYYTPGLMRLVAFHQASTAKMRGMSSLDNLLEQSFATHLQFKRLQERKYCAHVLTFAS